MIWYNLNNKIKLIMGEYMKKILKSKRFIIIFLLFIGIVWQGVMQKHENNKYEAPGTYVNTGNYDAHCYVKGDGDSTLVFITGSGTPSAYTDFYNLQDTLAKYSKTISFDHAGYGWSSKTKVSRDIYNLTYELSTIVDSLSKENKPLILVCHSLGSLEAINFAQRYKEKVAGIVFLDGGSPEFYSTSSETSSIAFNRGTSLLRFLGINRLLGNFSLLLPLYGENIRNKNLPENLKEVDKSMYYKYTGASINLSNLKSINENAKTVLNYGSNINVPILVLSSDSGEEWEKVQEELSSWSTDSRHITLKDSQHYIHWSNSDEVVSYIKEFTEELSK